MAWITSMKCALVLMVTGFVLTTGKELRPPNAPQEHSDSIFSTSFSPDLNTSETHTTPDYNASFSTNSTEISSGANDSESDSISSTKSSPMIEEISHEVTLSSNDSHSSPESYFSTAEKDTRNRAKKPYLSRHDDILISANQEENDLSSDVGKAKNKMRQQKVKSVENVKLNAEVVINTMSSQASGESNMTMKSSFETMESETTTEIVLTREKSNLKSPTMRSTKKRSVDAITPGSKSVGAENNTSVTNSDSGESSSSGDLSDETISQDLSHGVKTIPNDFDSDSSMEKISEEKLTSPLPSHSTRKRSVGVAENTDPSVDTTPFTENQESETHTYEQSSDSSLLFTDSSRLSSREGETSSIASLYTTLNLQSTEGMRPLDFQTEVMKPESDTNISKQLSTSQSSIQTMLPEVQKTDRISPLSYESTASDSQVIEKEAIPSSTHEITNPKESVSHANIQSLDFSTEVISHEPINEEEGLDHSYSESLITTTVPIDAADLIIPVEMDTHSDMESLNSDPDDVRLENTDEFITVNVRNTGLQSTKVSTFGKAGSTPDSAIILTEIQELSNKSVEPPSRASDEKSSNISVEGDVSINSTSGIVNNLTAVASNQQISPSNIVPVITEIDNQSMRKVIRDDLMLNDSPSNDASHPITGASTVTDKKSGLSGKKMEDNISNDIKHENSQFISSTHNPKSTSLTGPQSAQSEIRPVKTKTESPNSASSTPDSSHVSLSDVAITPIPSHPVPQDPKAPTQSGASTNPRDMVKISSEYFHVRQGNQSEEALSEDVKGNDSSNAEETTVMTAVNGSSISFSTVDQISENVTLINDSAVNNLSEKLEPVLNSSMSTANSSSEVPALQNPSTPAATTARTRILKPRIRMDGASVSESPRPRRPLPIPVRGSTTAGPPVSIFKKHRARRPSITSSTTQSTTTKLSTQMVHYASRVPGFIPLAPGISLGPEFTTTPVTTTTEEEYSEEPFTDPTHVPSVSSEDDVTLVKMAGTIVVEKGLRWDEQLDHRNSPRYKKKATEVLLHLERLFRSSPIGTRIWSIEIDGFSETYPSSGKVDVDFILSLIKLEETDETMKLIEVFNQKLKNNSFARYRVDPVLTTFEVLREERRNRPTQEPGVEPPIPQWAIAVIVIGAASFIFVVLFAAVTMYGRHHMRRRYSAKLNEDEIERPGDWESKMAAAYENLAADTIYDVEDGTLESVKRRQRMDNYTHSIPRQKRRYDSWRSGYRTENPRMTTTTTNRHDHRIVY